MKAWGRRAAPVVAPLVLGPRSQTWFCIEFGIAAGGEMESLLAVSVCQKAAGNLDPGHEFGVQTILKIHLQKERSIIVS